MKIIVSYRRSDSSATAGRIYDRLVAQFGQGSVFMDVDAIPFGTDFRSHIKSALLGSDIVLAVIGPNWLGPLADGTRRIDDEADPVRVEVETALANGITVVPVLIDGTPMPGSNQLPEPLKPLAFLNAAPVDMGRDFRLHADRLVQALQTILAGKGASPSAVPPPAPPPVSPPTVAAPGSSGRTMMFGLPGILLVALVGGGGWLMVPRSSPPVVASGDKAPVPPRAEPTVAPEMPRPVAEAPAPVPVPPVVPPVPGPPATPAPVPTLTPSPTPATPVAGPAPAPVQTSEPRIAVASRSQAHGTFAWYDLWTTNAGAAQAFYRSVIGWEGRTTGSGQAAYTILSAGQVPVAGLATLPAATVAQGVKPGWVGYVTVTNVDASVAEAKALGGALYLGPADVPGIGRYALVADPQGGYLALFKGLLDPPAATAEVPTGHAGWRDLQTTDRGAAVAFYERLFGWTTAAGTSGFAKDATTLGTIGQTGTGASWTFAFRVDGLATATARVVTGGGKVLGEPAEIAGGFWVVRCLDPQGAAFALMSRTR